jgi:UDP:flavonoid glycosyltransferase YjiC (YdhE family)
MRILFSSLGNYGHIHPLIPLASAARTAGHDVTFATGEQFHPVLARAGIDARPAGIPVPDAFIEAAGGAAFLEAAGPDVSASDLSPEDLHALSIRAFGSVLPRRVAADLAPMIQQVRPDLVVHEFANVGAGFAAALAGVPALCHGTGRPVTEAAEADLLAQVREVGADLGVTLPDDRVFTLGNRVVDICPAAVRNPDYSLPADRRIELRPIPHHQVGVDDVPLPEGSGPLAYLTLGTALGAAGVLVAAIHGLLAAGARVVVATGPAIDIADLGELPDGVVARPWVPQAELLGRADLVVSHAGSGTMLASLCAGRPQLMLPLGADQFHNAAAVAGAGAGLQILPADLGVEPVADAAARLLSDTTCLDAAMSIAKDIAAMPPPDDIAVRLPELTA